MGKISDKRSLRVHIITQDDPFYVPYFFEEFFKRLPNYPFKITGVWLTPPLDGSPEGALYRMYRFYGPGNFFRLCCRYVKKKFRRIFGCYANTIQFHSESFGIDPKQVNEVNDKKTLDCLRTKNPDLVLSIASSQIFGEQLLNIPNWGTLNLHDSFLPEHRGKMGTFWSMKNGAQKVGTTLHTATPDVDRGKILNQAEIAVHEGESLDNVMKRIKKKGAFVVLEGLNSIYNRTETLREMVGQGNYNSFPCRDDAKKLRQRGHPLI